MGAGFVESIAFFAFRFRLGTAGTPFLADFPASGPLVAWILFTLPPPSASKAKVCRTATSGNILPRHAAFAPCDDEPGRFAQ